jgi:hypothetical protein
MNQDCCEHCSSYTRGSDGVSPWYARHDYTPDTGYRCDKCVACDCLDEYFDEEVEG